MSNQRLKEPWCIDEDETLEHAAILFPRPRRRDDYRGNLFLSARGGFGQFLRRASTFPAYAGRIDTQETETIISQIFGALSVGGLVTVETEATSEDEVHGYQVPASAICWKTGDGTQSFHDPIRVPNRPQEGGATNPFFVDYYRSPQTTATRTKAREHTAQVPHEQRREREHDFRSGVLPILYCSPTMELGVDIAELNAVNMRNVPPTPANYAQRSGRAGRSGQPALVFSYCTTGSPHDQYFYKRPTQMVSGSVQPPRIDLSNQDLILAHIHSIWLAEVGVHLGSSLKGHPGRSG